MRKVQWDPPPAVPPKIVQRLVDRYPPHPSVQGAASGVSEGPDPVQDLYKGLLQQVLCIRLASRVPATECHQPGCISGIQLILRQSVSPGAKSGQPLLIPVVIHLHGLYLEKCKFRWIILL